MASEKQAIQHVLRQEDETRTGVVTHSADGKRTRFGIDEHYHPELTHSLFYSSMGTVAALAIAETIYLREYAEPLAIAHIESQQLANLLLSIGVNCGVRTAAKMLQDILRVNGDGRIGPLTLDAVDRSNSLWLIEQLRKRARQHYEDLVDAHPSLAVNLPGWLRRVSG